MILDGKRVVVTGGTGSLGHAIVGRLLSGEIGTPEVVTVFSRDEAKQHAMRMAFEAREVATDEIVYEGYLKRLRFRIGSVGDRDALLTVLRDAHVVIHAAALKQVPTCEYVPFEAVKANVIGAENIVRLLQTHQLEPEVVVGVSTDKACKPVNVMGMTKAIAERILLQANLECPRTRIVVARYGNVLGTRGSVIPVFHEQVDRGGPVTVTTPEMTRFLMSLGDAVDAVFAAIKHARPGEIFVPRVPSARMVDVAQAIIGERELEIAFSGIRPGEKVHELLVSEEESPRTTERNDYLVIGPGLPELHLEDPGAPAGTLPGSNGTPLREYSSATNPLDLEAVTALLDEHGMLLDSDRRFTR
jgi:UDP-glucose 4-epimerase